MEDLNGQIAKSEAHIEHDRMKVGMLEKQLNESVYLPRVPPPLEAHKDRSNQKYREMPNSPVFEDVDETFMTEDLSSEESFVQPSAR